LSYFTERLDPGPTRQNAFEHSPCTVARLLFFEI
jgi:hypothetical protein